MFGEVGLDDDGRRGDITMAGFRAQVGLRGSVAAGGRLQRRHRTVRVGVRGPFSVAEYARCVDVTGRDDRCVRLARTRDDACGSHRIRAPGTDLSVAARGGDRPGRDRFDRSKPPDPGDARLIDPLNLYDDRRN